MAHVMARVLARVGTAPEDPARSTLPILRLLAVCAVALTTANCANNPQKLAGAASSDGGIDPKYGVRASRRLYNEGDVIPKGGGRRFSGKPYVVAGKTYVPREDAKGYVREGLASWYGSAFHGRVTANGEVFDRHSIAAAHPTLPLPSYVRVTNLDNGYSMMLRVNDRGPYHAGRVMDVSEEAARALDFHRRGTARVRIEYAGKASVAGSDDRKLLATLRTDGRPASVGRAPVMMADLGPSEPEVAPERLERSSRALAFRPANERDDDAPETVPAARPARPAPVVLASAAVAVPAALQPTAGRAAPFRPAPVALAAVPKASPGQPAPGKGAPGTAPEQRRMVAEAGRHKGAAHPATPLRLASAPDKAAPAKSAAPAKGPAMHAAATAAKSAARPAGKGAAPEPAARMAAMPPASKVAIARLAGTAPAAAKPAATGGGATKTAAAQASNAHGTKAKRSQVAAAN